jgi:ABC-type spermidine/putrescine transport system permease subunit I
MDRGVSAPPRLKRRRRDELRGWYPRWFLGSLALPGTWWMLVFLALPLFTMLAVAFGGVDPLFGSPLPVWNPLRWDASTLSDVMGQLVRPQGAFFAPAVRTLTFTAIATLMCLVIGYPVAYTVSRHAGRWKAALLGLLLAPFFISYLMRMLAWVNLLRDDGLVNRVLEVVPFAQPQQWLGGKPITVILGLVYGYVPYMILPLFGSLDAVDRSFLEGARDLGARPSEVFRRITWPLSRPAVIAGVLIVGLPITGDYYTADLLSGSPRTTTLANQIDFLLHARNAGPTVGTALVCLLAAALVLPMLWYLRLVGDAADERDEGTA